MTQLALLLHLLGVDRTIIFNIVSCLLVASAVAMFFPQYIVAVIYSHKKIHQPESNMLTHLLSELSSAINIRTPKLLLNDDENINAFASAGFFNSGMIVLNTSVLSKLTQDEIESVLAHELAHISKGHALIMTQLQFIFLLMFFLPSMLILSPFKIMSSDFKLFNSAFNLSNFVSLILFPVMTILMLFVGRRWEFQADRMAGELVGQAKLISTLRCLNASFFQHINVLNLNRVSSRRLSLVAWTHPNMEQRINYLNESNT